MSLDMADLFAVKAFLIVMMTVCKADFDDSQRSLERYLPITDLVFFSPTAPTHIPISVQRLQDRKNETSKQNRHIRSITKTPHEAVCKSKSQWISFKYAKDIHGSNVRLANRITTSTGEKTKQWFFQTLCVKQLTKFMKIYNKI